MPGIPFALPLTNQTALFFIVSHVATTMHVYLVLRDCVNYLVLPVHCDLLILPFPDFHPTPSSSLVCLIFPHWDYTVCVCVCPHTPHFPAFPLFPPSHSGVPHPMCLVTYHSLTQLFVDTPSLCAQDMPCSGGVFLLQFLPHTQAFGFGLLPPRPIAGLLPHPSFGVLPHSLPYCAWPPLAGPHSHCGGMYPLNHLFYPRKILCLLQCILVAPLFTPPGDFAIINATQPSDYLHTCGACCFPVFADMFGMGWW